MKQIDNISISELPDALIRAGFSDTQRLRVTVEPVADDGSESLASLAQAGKAFDFWNDEPEHYSESDVKVWYG